MKKRDFTVNSIRQVDMSDLKELMEDLSDSGLVFIPPMANEPQCIIGSFI